VTRAARAPSRSCHAFGIRHESETQDSEVGDPREIDQAIDQGAENVRGSK